MGRDAGPYELHQNFAERILCKLFSQGLLDRIVTASSASFQMLGATGSRWLQATGAFMLRYAALIAASGVPMAGTKLAWV